MLTLESEGRESCVDSPAEQSDTGLFSASRRQRAHRGELSPKRPLSILPLPVCAWYFSQQEVESVSPLLESEGVL